MKKALSFIVMVFILGAAFAQQEKPKKKKRKGFILHELNHDITYLFRITEYDSSISYYDYLVLNRIPDFKYSMMDSLYRQGHTTDDSLIDIPLMILSSKQSWVIVTILATR